MTKYQNAKKSLKAVADLAMKKNPLDKSRARQVINDVADILIRELRLTEYQAKLLSNYACVLHPK
jgi:hypothetical protein